MKMPKTTLPHLPTPNILKLQLLNSNHILLRKSLLSNQQIFLYLLINIFSLCFNIIQPPTAAATPPQLAYINPPSFNYSQQLHKRPPMLEGRFGSYTQNATAVETARQNSIAQHPPNKKKPATLIEKNTLARVIFHAQTVRSIVFNDMKVEGLWETVDIQ